jgi:hypothetical protein
MATLSIQPTTSFLQGSWPERAASLFRVLPDFLTWKSGSSMIDAVTEFHETWVDKRLHRWSRATESTHAQDINDLPPFHRRRIRWAPEVLAILRLPTPGKTEFSALRKFIEIEEYLCDMRSEVEPGCWSALGDYFSGSPKSEFSLCPRFRNIFVDYRSPYAQRHMDLPIVEQHSPEEEPLVMRGLETGFSIVEQTSPVCVKMIDSMVAVIIAFPSKERGESMSSLSMRRYFGAMGLINMHKAKSSGKSVADTLVHETIHSLIYRLELFKFMFIDDQASMPMTVKSPWTGNKLSMQSFVHACFVWFGLWNFWEISASLGCDAPALRKRAKNGFLTGEPATLVTREDLDNVQPHVRSAIEQMFEMVRAE